jgi:hypothetical protein
MIRLHFVPLLFAALAMAPLAQAHDDATLDATVAPNGGQLRMAGIYHYELQVAPAGKAAQAAPIIVYVTDHAGTKVPTAGAAGTATLLSGTKKTIVALAPDRDNRMKGDAVYQSAPDMKVIVSISFAGKPAEAARFMPLARPINAGHDMRHP